MFHLVINLIRIRVIRMAMSYECKDFMIHQNLLALTCLIQFKVYLYIYGKDAHTNIEICIVEGQKKSI